MRRKVIFLICLTYALSGCATGVSTVYVNKAATTEQYLIDTRECLEHGKRERIKITSNISSGNFSAAGAGMNLGYRIAGNNALINSYSECLRNRGYTERELTSNEKKILNSLKTKEERLKFYIAVETGRKIDGTE